MVELAEIRVADVENTALTTYTDPPNTYRHFGDDGFGDFRDKSHADGFLNFFNSLTDDLQYTIEYPSNDGSLPYIDILVNADKSTYVYRKPTHTNLYVHSIPVPLHPPKTVSSGPLLDEPTSYAPQHLQKELNTVYTTSSQNGHP